MDKKEAIARIEEHIEVHKIGEYPHIKIKKALDLAIQALKEKQEREQIWHTEPPLKEGLYYGKTDETNSMYPVRYKDGKWYLSTCCGHEMEIIKWAYWGSFVSE